MITRTLTPEQFQTGEGRSIRRPIDRAHMLSMLRKVLDNERRALETAHMLLHTLDGRIRHWAENPNSAMTHKNIEDIIRVMDQLKSPDINMNDAMKTLKGEIP